jgi:hypothetical protein
MAKAPYTLQFCVEDNLRYLSRMLACLDRIGKDLYLEAANGQVCCWAVARHIHVVLARLRPRLFNPAPLCFAAQVSLRTLNAAQSAFVKFYLRWVPAPEPTPSHTERSRCASPPQAAHGRI